MRIVTLSCHPCNTQKWREERYYEKKPDHEHDAKCESEITVLVQKCFNPYSQEIHTWASQPVKISSISIAQAGFWENITKYKSIEANATDRKKGNPMYCRKCGRQLRDDDEFCSMCGTKVIREEMSSVEVESEEPAFGSPSGTNETPIQIHNEGESRKKYSFRQSLVRFVACMAALTVCYTLIYAMFPSRASTLEYLISPRGMTSALGQGLGSALSIIVFLLPLLYALPKCGYTRRTYAMEVFFVLNLMPFLLGQHVMRTIVPPLMMIGLIAGIAMQINARRKKSNTEN